MVGMLLIDLATRRRLRINGRITRSTPGQLRLDVDAAYPNCPKYIQRRHLTISGSKGSSAPRRGRSLEDDQLSLIRKADTFFVASAHPIRGVDASHRGGNPGFIRVLDNHKIRIPDYVGNSMFSTLGNFAENPRAGLLFFDIEGSRTLQLVGRPEIQWELDDPLHATGNTKRYWDLEIDRWLEMDLPYRLEWEFLDYSPHNPVGDNSSTWPGHQ
jgi:predicted pyridoxine 5'-phosphate oxidase superfamily flavin-nucleotide-binding protein